MALVAHPDDVRYQPLFGSEVVTPLFKVPVPVKAHPLADPEKGSGIAMICTFGDLTDVTWWRELALPVRAVIQANGTLKPVTFGSEGWPSRDAAAAQGAYDQLAGLSAAKARTRIVELLRESGDLVGDPRPITHPVKFYEKGDRPLEIVTSRQWFIKTMEFRDALLARGRELQWHPEYMAHRFENWVNGLSGDWCVSRQRFFGVPFPVWYPVRADGTIDYAQPLLPDEARLPIDPSTDTPDGYRPDQRDQPGGFTGDPDVMDTWATSSLTPHVAGGWLEDPALFAQVFPMDVRPQAHDIIRTWLFTTVLRAQLEHGRLPWHHAAISGWVLDPDRKKMSKSKGNVVTPMGLLQEHGSDGVRYWAASGRPGTDTAFDAAQMKVGRRLAIKLLNASRFALLQAEPRGPITEPLDRGMLTNLSRLVGEATTSLDAYDYARVLERTESFFWSFCDDYLEMVKSRRYGDFGPGRRGERQQRDARGPLDAAAALRAVSALRHRGSVVVVAAGPRAPRPVADAGRSGGADRRRRRCGGGGVGEGAGRAGRRSPRSRPMQKRPVKSVIERAVLPAGAGGARCRPRAISRRRRTFATCALPTSPAAELVFAEESAVKAGEPGV